METKASRSSIGIRRICTDDSSFRSKLRALIKIQQLARKKLEQVTGYRRNDTGGVDFYIVIRSKAQAREKYDPHKNKNNYNDKEVQVVINPSQKS